MTSAQTGSQAGSRTGSQTGSQTGREATLPDEDQARDALERVRLEVAKAVVGQDAAVS